MVYKNFIILFLNKYLKIYIILLVILSFTKNGLAAQITLQWDQKGNSSVAGYNVYYGISRSDFKNQIRKRVQGASTTECQIYDLHEGMIYVFVVSNVDQDGNEIGFSEELYYDVTMEKVVSDADGDGLYDSEEADIFGTDPYNSDTDGDNLSDSAEIMLYSTNSFQVDSDDDGLEDETEILQNTDPNSPDSDNDGLSDSQELVTYGTDPNNADTDGDGFSDGEEQAYWADEWDLDYDGDGVVNLLDPDADGDKISDGYEVSHGYLPSYQDGVDDTSMVHVSGIQPLHYSLVELREGIAYYNDRRYALLSLPDHMIDGDDQLIVTNNDDKGNTSEIFIEFTITEPAKVYVAYDCRALSLPSWLASGFFDTYMTIEVSDSMGHFNVYEATYEAGTVQLGGNAASGADGAGSNYIVVVSPDDPDVVNTDDFEENNQNSLHPNNSDLTNSVENGTDSETSGFNTDGTSGNATQTF